MLDVDATVLRAAAAAVYENASDAGRHCYPVDVSSSAAVEDAFARMSAIMAGSPTPSPTPGSTVRPARSTSLKPIGGTF
jgi:hypothetical protein